MVSKIAESAGGSKLKPAATRKDTGAKVGGKPGAKAGKAKGKDGDSPEQRMQTLGPVLEDLTKGVCDKYVAAGFAVQRSGAQAHRRIVACDACTGTVSTGGSKKLCSRLRWKAAKSRTRNFAT